MQLNIIRLVFISRSEYLTNQKTIIMKLVKIIAVLVLVAQISYAQSKDVKPFTGLAISGNISAEIIKSNEERVEYEIIKGDSDHLIIKNKDKVLVVKTESSGSYDKETKAKVKIYYKNINDLEISSGVTVRIEDPIESRHFVLEVSSGSSVTLGLVAEKADIEVSSGSSVTLEGHCDDVDLEVSSGSSLRANDFEVKNLDVEVSSGSSTKISVSESITGEASSGSSLSYDGNPNKVNVDKDISSSVRKM